MTTLIERDLEIARQIQQSFLPATLPQVPGWEVATYFQPAREVAGDFYDLFPMVQNRRIGLVIADVCDKGIAAALFMALCRSLLRAFAQQHHPVNWSDILEPDKGHQASDPLGGLTNFRRNQMPTMGTNALKNAVSLTNNYLVENHGETNMFATLFFGVLDPVAGTLHYINAGHNPPLIFNRSEVKQLLATTGPAIGLLPDSHFAIQQTELAPGDTLLAFTDGITEARNRAGHFFGEERLVAAVTQPAPTLTAVLTRLDQARQAFIGTAEQSDDVTLLAVQRHAQQP